MVIDSFFSGGWLSGRFTRDTGVVPVQWIIDPMPRGERGGHRCQWQRGRPWAWTHNVFVNGRDKRARGNETEGDRWIIKVSEEGDREVEELPSESDAYLVKNRKGNGQISSNRPSRREEKRGRNALAGYYGHHDFLFDCYYSQLTEKSQVCWICGYFG